MALCLVTLASAYDTPDKDNPNGDRKQGGRVTFLQEFFVSKVSNNRIERGFKTVEAGCDFKLAKELAEASPCLAELMLSINTFNNSSYVKVEAGRVIGPANTVVLGPNNITIKAR